MFSDSMLCGVSSAGYSFKNLGSLFSGGSIDGVMIDLTDTTTLFQDANGILPVTANNDPVGFALDQHKWGGLTLAAYRASQSEMVTNGDFSGGLTGWTTFNAGNVSIVGDAIRITPNDGTTRYAYQTLTTVPARWYEISVDYLGGTSPGASIRVGTAAGSSNLLNSGSLSGIGTKRYFFKAASTTSLIHVVNAGASGTTADFDNVSVKEIDGHHATAANRPTWASASNDLLFDGVNDVFITTYRAGAQTKACMASYVKSNTPARWFLGAFATGYFDLGHRSPNGVAYMHFANSTEHAGTTVITGAYHSVVADRDTVNAHLAVDGAVEATKASPGTSFAIPHDILIGAVSNNGTPVGYLAGNMKRVVMGSFRIQDTMTLADFHQNLIA